MPRHSIPSDFVLDSVGSGVPNDGVTNAQTALGNMHAALPSTGGKISLRRGQYLMNTRLITTKQGMVLEGEGTGSTTLLLAVAGFQVGCSDVLIKNMTIKANVANTQQLFQIVTTGAYRNWRFENVKFDGVGVTPARIGATDSTGTVTTSGSGLTDHVEFDRCEFTNYTEDGCLFFRGIDHGTVSRCWFHDLGTDINKGDALKFSYGSNYWRALHCTFENCKRDGIDCYDGQRGLIDGCNIIAPAVHGIEMKTASASPPNAADHNRVTNCHIVNAGSATAAPAIQASVPYSSVSNNLIEGGSSYGIRCGKTNDGVSNNHDITWTNNIVQGVTAQAFYLNGVDRAVLSGNIALNSNRGFDASSSVNSGVIGSGLNISNGNTNADIWT